MVDLLVGLPDVNVLGIDETGDELRLHIECRLGLVRCPDCGSGARLKDRYDVELVDLCCFGRRCITVWRKHRWHCRNESCPVGSWITDDRRIASPRLLMTDRAGRWATFQVGHSGRSVNEVARELGCDWHTVNNAVIAYGTTLVEDPDRFADVEALGLDETMFCHITKTDEHNRRWKQKYWSTSIVDVTQGQLLDVVTGRDAQGPIRWLRHQPNEWRDNIVYGTLDLSGPYRKVFDEELPHATQVADPFHVVKLANSKLDECRRRVQNETLGHRGRKTDPLYRCRKLLVLADERVDDHGRERLSGLLAAGDPNGEVAKVWQAKEAVRAIYSHSSYGLARRWIERLAYDLQQPDHPVETRSLGRTLHTWRRQICAWHDAQVTNGPTEAVNNLIKRVKRVAFGFTNFTNYRIRALLYAGKPNWALLNTIQPH